MLARPNVRLLCNLGLLFCLQCLPAGTDEWVVASSVQVSPQDFDHDYHFEERGGDYPRVLAPQDGPVLVAMRQGSRVCVAGLVRGRLVATKTIEPPEDFLNHLDFLQWEGQAFYACSADEYEPFESTFSGPNVRVYQYDFWTEDLALKDQVDLGKGKDFPFEGRKWEKPILRTFPVPGRGFMSIGEHLVYHFVLGGMVSGDFPQTQKQFSVVWKAGTHEAFQEIEQKRRHTARWAWYAVSPSGNVHALWADRQYVRKDDPMVCYSENLPGRGWTNDVILHTAPTYVVMDCALTAVGENPIVFWEESDGTIVARVRQAGEWTPAKRIGRVDGRFSEKHLFERSMAATSAGGLAFVYIAGVEEDVIYSLDPTALGVVQEIRWRQPKSYRFGADLTVDSAGDIHVVYLKQPDVVLTRQTICHYRWVQRGRP